MLMMRSIYAIASKTIVWSGEEKQDRFDGLAVSILHPICEKAHTTRVSERGELQRALCEFFQTSKEQSLDANVPDDTPTRPSYRTEYMTRNWSHSRQHCYLIKSMAALIMKHLLQWWLCIKCHGKFVAG